MGWNRKPSRQGRAAIRRPDLECLEVRQLLSLTEPVAAASSSAFVRANGTVAYDQVIQASSARASFGVDGTGSNVAVIDTGVEATNPAFGTGTVGQPGNKIVAGVDFTGSPSGISPTWQHGTGVTGLIASQDPTNPGVAPGAGIVALRVFGDENQGSFDRIAQALNWVVQNHDQYNITAVNLSVSDGGNYQSNLFGNDGSAGEAITSAVKTLDGENIPVIVATGNNFDGKTQGSGFASIIPETISVTSTDETKPATKGVDSLASDAQRLGSTKGGASATDIAAPGVDLIAPSGKSGTATDFGTSFAAPQVTGAVVLLQQMYRQAHGTLPTVDQLEGWLKAGAVPVVDSVTGIDIGRLNVANSLSILQGQIQAQKQSSQLVAAAQMLAPPVVSMPAPVVVTPAVVVTPVIATPPAIDPTFKDVATTAPTTAVLPMTEVFLNGTSQGSFATSQLSSRFAGLFALTKGVAKNLRAWAPVGSSIDLGAVQPSGEVINPPTERNKKRGKAERHIVTAAVLPTTSARSFLGRGPRNGRPAARSVG